MWLFVVVIFTSVCFSCADDHVPEIQINVFVNKSNSGDLECVGVPATLMFNETFRIYVNHTGDIFRHRCYRNKECNEGLIDKFTQNKQNNRRGYVSENCITMNLGTWHYACEFYTRKCNDSIRDQCFYTIVKNGVDNRYENKGIKCDVEVNVLKRKEFNSTVPDSAFPDSALIYSACGGVLLIAIGVMLTIVVRRKRKRATPKLETTDFNYMTQQKDQSVPIQCPNEYAVPVDSKESHTYSVPYNARTDQETYSTPVPVNQRHEMGQPDVTYAELQLGRSEDSTAGYRKRTENDDTYAQITHTSQLKNPIGF